MVAYNLLSMLIFASFYETNIAIFFSAIFCNAQSRKRLFKNYPPGINPWLQCAGPSYFVVFSRGIR